MNGCGKLTVELSWDENDYCCIFKRGRDTEDWNDLTIDEQKRAIGAMVTMSEMFGKFIKESEVNNEKT